MYVTLLISYMYITLRDVRHCSRLPQLQCSVANDISVISSYPIHELRTSPLVLTILYFISTHIGHMTIALFFFYNQGDDATAFRQCGEWVVMEGSMHKL